MGKKFETCIFIRNNKKKNMKNFHGFFYAKWHKITKNSQKWYFSMFSCMCLEHVCGASNFFAFFLKYISASPMIL